MAVPSSALSDEDGASRLREFDLTEDVLQEAGFVGYSAAASCTNNDPRSLPGTLAWARMIAHLRDAKAGDGWRADRGSNYETVVDRTRTRAIAVAAGTPATGRRGSTPKTRTPKGTVTRRRVRENAQLSLGHGTSVFAGPGVAAADDHAEPIETWMLLHYFDKDAEEIRLELSLPLEMSGSQITAWRERIILGAVSFSSELDIDLTIDDDLPIDIDVSRKAH